MEDGDSGREHAGSAGACDIGHVRISIMGTVDFEQ